MYYGTKVLCTGILLAKRAIPGNECIVVDSITPISNAPPDWTSISLIFTVLPVLYGLQILSCIRFDAPCYTLSSPFEGQKCKTTNSPWTLRRISILVEPQHAQRRYGLLPFMAFKWSHSASISFPLPVTFDGWLSMKASLRQSLTSTSRSVQNYYHNQHNGRHLNQHTGTASSLHALKITQIKLSLLKEIES